MAEDERTQFLRSWLHGNPAGTSPSWHPYPTSLRIVSWCKAGVDDCSLRRSLYRQTASLRRTIETEVMGNHLLENARALVFGGLLWAGHGDADEWWNHGLGLLEREVQEQVLADGWHYERSPMYHALMLELVLDVANVLPESWGAFWRLLDLGSRMARALEGVLHPDGSIPLVGDSALGIAPPSEALFDYARRLGADWEAAGGPFPDAGFYPLAAPDVHLLLSARPAEPGHLLAHAHADGLSIELSVAGERLLVDPGVHGYAESPLRNQLRATPAHNTVSIDGLSQWEPWETFRWARRWPTRVDVVEDRPKLARIEGVFDGWRRLVGDGVSHRRIVELDREHRTVRIRDVVTGRGRHLITSRYSVAPGWTLRESTDGWTLLRGTSAVEVATTGPARLGRGVYSTRFGIAQKCATIDVGAEVELPVTFELTLRY